MPSKAKYFWRLVARVYLRFKNGLRLRSISQKFTGYWLLTTDTWLLTTIGFSLLAYYYRISGSIEDGN